MTYSYSIFDSIEDSAWPDHTTRAIEAATAGEAVGLVAARLARLAARLDSADGYESGDTIVARVWDSSGRILATLTQEVTL